MQKGDDVDRVVSLYRALADQTPESRGARTLRNLIGYEMAKLHGFKKASDLSGVLRGACSGENLMNVGVYTSSQVTALREAGFSDEVIARG